jgi:hypothetical protein
LVLSNRAGLWNSNYALLDLYNRGGMVVKKILFLLVTIPLLLMGCSSSGTSGNTKLNDFDNTQLKAKLEDAAFQPQLPTKMPIEIKQADFTPPPKEHMPLSIHFYGSGNGNGDHLELMVFNNQNGEGVHNSGVNFEEVKIGDIKGKYGVNDSEAMMLNWTEDDNYYALTYYGQQSDTEITKEDLIETAKSFK